MKLLINYAAIKDIVCQQVAEKLALFWVQELIYNNYSFITSGEDAEEAIKVGCSAVYVSNHGGRQLDGVSSSVSRIITCNKDFCDYEIGDEF